MVRLSQTLFTAAAGQENSGQVILHLDAGDELVLNNFASSGGIMLQNTAGGSQTNVDASIVIEQVG